ncbi:MAG: plasmid pRiA4b ORF-3 family protein [Treponema sp.]|nr:plasmid pRiA4b ORF-3 family protein [Treponema sp.]
MTINQEDALYEFLETVTKPFTLEEVLSFIRMVDPKRSGRLGTEVAAFIDSRNIAFRLDLKQWISRRGCFEPVQFVIIPTRLELLNGILIPGHRCIPFANPVLLPQEYVFHWQGMTIPYTTTEGPPEEFYPFYSIFGEEYAPQYVARDNPENEEAFNSDPYDDPPEVSIHTLDMRNIYRETSFVPGDRFVVSTVDWKTGIFELERVGKDAWTEEALAAWFKAAERGFEDSFALLGPGTSTEEQAAYAYWYGGKRMREVPAYALEEFLYEKTDRIETTAYGIETRFWYAGKEIPDRKDPEESRTLPDRTVIEEILFQKKIPVSEYVVQSYVRDALFRNDPDIPTIIERIVPPSVELREPDWDYLADYVADVLDEFRGIYSLFADKSMGPIRQRVGELHTAVIDLAARLQKGDIDPAWLPKHTFVILSQIQSHAASVLEDLDVDEAPVETELEAMDNSLDSMIETYEDIKELIEESLNSFRRNKLSVVKDTGKKKEVMSRKTIQVSVGGTDVWRRIIIPASYTLKDLHRVIQTIFDWNNGYPYRFILEGAEKKTGWGVENIPEPFSRIGDLCARGISEILYEYGTKWTVKIIFLSYNSYTDNHAGSEAQVRCIAGAGAAPPENIEGPLRFRKILSALAKGNDSERQGALHELGRNFDPDGFDMEACNRNLTSGSFIKT